MATNRNHSVRLPIDMLKRLKEVASFNQRTFNGQVVYMLTQQLKVADCQLSDRPAFAQSELAAT